ncbi:MAG: hypothetical protein RL558_803, partial [Bacteroidota bacterium]
VEDGLDLGTRHLGVDRVGLNALARVRQRELEAHLVGIRLF